MTIRILVGDCKEHMAGMEANSVDAIVTDPPAGISFMGKSWDDNKGGRDAWVAWLADVMGEAYRVAKPGAHAVVWALPRTSGWTHRALEDAGWEVRDCLLHLFGSGFPKSLDVSKAIDKTRRRDYVLAAIDLGLAIPGNNLHDWTKAEHSPGDVWWEKFKDHLSDEQWQDIERAVVGHWNQPGRGKRSEAQKYGLTNDSGDITAPATDLARQWDGWGTALKPAAEFWYLARKPLIGSVAANVTQYGTGGINVDGCRIDYQSAADLATSEGKNQHTNYKNPGSNRDSYSGDYPPRVDYDGSKGRWPANVILGCACEGETHEPDCAAAMLDAQSGESRSTDNVRYNRARNPAEVFFGQADKVDRTTGGYNDTGGASRFFYTAKASRAERNKGLDGMPEHRRSVSYGSLDVRICNVCGTKAKQAGLNGRWPHCAHNDWRWIEQEESANKGMATNHHPTVKPVSLMQWLCRLVTPPGGVILDMFGGSGSTMVAADREGFDGIYIDMSEEYAAIARRRIVGDAPLFADIAAD